VTEAAGPPRERAARADVRIGISGWRYAGWRGIFYPPRWPHARELEYASRRVNSVEINGSFYSLQHPDSYRAWYEQTPEHFVFAVKGGRFITHMKRLGDVERPLANFFASGVLRLGDKLGPILWQLPPRLSFDPGRLETFLELLPRDTRAAARLARRHDERLAGRAWTRTDRTRPVRHAIEVRHRSFVDPAFIALLRRHRVALVVADTAGTWPLMEDVTAEFVYIRLHGDAELYVSGYTDAALAVWAGKIRAWSEGRAPAGPHLVGPPARERARRDVYCYFDNDVKVRAPFDAMALAHRLDLGSDPGEPPEVVPVPAAPGAGRSRWPGFGARSGERGPSP
jgi:uncharacterized protein YecE (DUF72 family)